MDISYDDLYDLYITKEKTLKSISHQFNLPMEIVYAKLLDYGIDTSRIQPSIRSVLDYKSYFYTQRFIEFRKAIYIEREYKCAVCKKVIPEESLLFKHRESYRYARNRFNKDNIILICKSCYRIPKLFKSL
jgi:RNase P subunit RPR2